ncbi:tryptophan halogenase family protein [Thalassotalea agarivorans]|uniref:Dehydrogenase (Flavoprotein) n=1 Tax=Thalassotalea agarivorans TaxID=349064 RepID=A0A1I0E1L5_THASX|nr:tryptophan halogenase family protein [Thalassotalea agarivorans]SET38615.1 Dehydrogenase (flavoprotein) [Thalassotalea agarivorans]
MVNESNSIVIVGGGTAGWITAGVIAAQHKGQVSVTLVESPDIPTIGVGEGTWPTMRKTLEQMGISETTFVRQCDASFKQGSLFKDWHSIGHQYYHPFTLPTGYQEINLAPYWLPHKQRMPFAFATSPQAAICEQGLAPKQIGTKEYAFFNNYGYHLDAGKFSELLKQHCVESLAVKHVLANVATITNDASGDIDHLVLDSGETISGKLFVDCTGQHSLLLGKHYNVSYLDQSKYLFNDTAIALQLPYKTEQENIASATISTGQSCGWIWDIGLPTRRGTGLVYSSAHADEQTAMDVLMAYAKERVTEQQFSQLSPRKISIAPGYRKEFWHRNCVAVGMSAGFIEPLEASALALVELSAKMISEQLPKTREAMTIVANRFNKKFEQRWQQIIDFLKLHYVLSERDDSAYWRDHRDPAGIPESLQEQLILWKTQSPYTYDSMYTEELFPSASNQYILYGMDFTTDIDPTSLANVERADRLINENLQRTRQMMAALPTNRELLQQVKAQGFAKI